MLRGHSSVDLALVQFLLRLRQAELDGRPLGLERQSAWDGGFFGVIGWAIPMLLGTIAYDIMASHTPWKATARILLYGILLMGVGYALNCLATLYDTDKGHGRPGR